MTSRDRGLAAIAHRESDRVPVDLGSTPSSGISALAYSALARELGSLDARPYVYDVVQELAQPPDWMLSRLSIDVMDIGRAFDVRSEDREELEMPDGSRYLYPSWFKPIRQGDDFFVYDSEGTLIAQRPSGATFFDERCFPTRRAIPPIIADCHGRWAKCSGRPLSTRPGTTRATRTSGRSCGSGPSP